MMKRTLLAAIMMSAFCAGTFAQSSFQKTLGVEETEDVYGVLQTPDGGFIIASTYSPVLVPRKIRLVKTDASGNQQWAKLVGDTRENNPRTIQATSDGGYIIGGFLATNMNTGFLLVKTDASGNQLWWKMYNPKDRKAYGYCARQTADGGYIICGSVSGINQDVYLVKTDASGTLVWEKTYGGDNEDVAFSVFQTTDGGYILGGKTKSYGDTDGDAYLLKVSADGTEEWKKTFDGPMTYEDYIHCVRQTADGGYIAVGNSSSRIIDIYLLKTDSKGNKQWSKNFGDKGTEEGRWVEPTADGGYIVGGFTNTTRPSASDRDMYLLKTDASGNEQWHQIYGGKGINLGRTCMQTADGGYVFVGVSNAINSRNGILLIKTDANGK